MRILEVQTEHTAPFKVLFEVLKDMLTETNIEFISSQPIKKTSEVEGEFETEDETDNKKGKKKEKDCMKINAVDPTKTVLINLKLDNFSSFVCKKSKVLLGVNLGCFYKLIKSMGKNDILTLGVDHDNKNYLNIKIESPNEQKESEFDMKLLDLDETKMSIPEITFDTVITMDSQEFNKLCREMNNIADYVEIKCLTDKIIFTCRGDIASRTTTYRASTKNEDGSDENETNLVNISFANTKGKNSNIPQIVQGIFELKNLVLFSKCAALCNDIEIYMKNNFPLVIKYTVATLGRILLCLTPIKEDATKNANYSDEEEFYSDE